jgi:hypothetical protein
MTDTKEITISTKMKQSNINYWEDWDEYIEKKETVESSKEIKSKEIKSKEIKSKEIISKEKNKQLEERKLMEESDKNLIEQLFQVKENPDDYYHKYN